MKTCCPPTDSRLLSLSCYSLRFPYHQPLEGSLWYAERISVFLILVGASLVDSQVLSDCRGSRWGQACWMGRGIFISMENYQSLIFDPTFWWGLKLRSQFCFGIRPLYRDYRRLYDAFWIVLLPQPAYLFWALGKYHDWGMTSGAKWDVETLRYLASLPSERFSRRKSQAVV